MFSEIKRVLPRASGRHGRFCIGDKCADAEGSRILEVADSVNEPIISGIFFGSYADVGKAVSVAGQAFRQEITQGSLRSLITFIFTGFYSTLVFEGFDSPSRIFEVYRP